MPVASKKQVYRTVADSGPISCRKVAQQLGCDWHTAKDRLDQLLQEGSIHAEDVNERLTLYADHPIQL